MSAFYILNGLCVCECDGTIFEFISAFTIMSILTGSCKFDFR